MSNTISSTFESFELPVELYKLIDEIKLTEKDKIIIDYLLENGNEPTHEGGIARKVTIIDKSGRRLRSITRKHTGERCEYLEEKLGLLTHVSRKPLRGAGYRTPHYFLSDEIEAFQTLVDIYLKKENIMRMIIFMESRYLEKAVEKNLKPLLVRWLLPDKRSEYQNALLLFLIHEKLRTTFSEPVIAIESKKKRIPSRQNQFKRSEGTENIVQILQALRSINRKEIENDLLSFFKNIGIFTEKQISTYSSIAKISPTALNILVFLPFPKLLEQYEKLGLTNILAYKGKALKGKGKQSQEWLFLNKIIHEILYHSMIVDLTRYPFLILPKRKYALLREIMHNKKR